MFEDKDLVVACVKHRYYKGEDTDCSKGNKLYWMLRVGVQAERRRQRVPDERAYGRESSSVREGAKKRSSASLYEEVIAGWAHLPVSLGCVVARSRL
jgi:hypothetical protein